MARGAQVRGREGEEERGGGEGKEGRGGKGEEGRGRGGGRGASPVAREAQVRGILFKKTSRTNLGQSESSPLSAQE